MVSFSCSVEGEECLWEFSDDHNVFTGSKVNKSHSHFYLLKSISQLEKSLSVCSILRLKIAENGLLIVQMVIKNEVQYLNRENHLEVIDEGKKSEQTVSKDQVFNTEFVIFPVS